MPVTEKEQTGMEESYEKIFSVILGRGSGYEPAYCLRRQGCSPDRFREQ